MTHLENTPNAAQGNPSEVVGSSVPASLAAEITKDAKDGKRSESFVIREILLAHYAPRLAKNARRQKRAA